MQKIIREIRSFNRYYTGVIGLLDKHYLNSSLSLPEARILFEIANSRLCTAKKIISATNIDRGYLSRILAGFYFKKIIVKKRCRDDARIVYLSLSSRGKRMYSRLNTAQNSQIIRLINKLDAKEQKKLVNYMKGIRKLLNKKQVTT